MSTTLARLQGKFHLTEVSRNFLLPTKPFYWVPMLRMLCQIPLSDRALVESLRRDGAIAWGNGNVITDEWAQAELPDERVHRRVCHAGVRGILAHQRQEARPALRKSPHLAALFSGEIEQGGGETGSIS
ncbi:hypothetical protein [Sorangium sp. So ce1153]|uniref:hypothetical protein n=1 Tax=Sorangium sp. So ce1153 TaxID=3133333 RepID=UPI003F5EE3A0